MTATGCEAFRSLYDVLGVAPDVDSRGLRQAYRRGALALHPDRRQGTTVAPALGAAAPAVPPAPAPPTVDGIGTTASSSMSSLSEQHGPVPPPPLHPLSSSTGSAPAPLLPPFEVLCEAAQLLMDPVRRRAYDQRLLLDRARSGVGRVSNADTITFRLAKNSTNTNHCCDDDDDDEVFAVLSDNDEIEKDGEDTAEEVGHISGSGGSRWCGLECRCGGYYRLLVPAAYFDEGPRNSNDNNSITSNASSPSWRTRTAHVECDTCSLVIAVEGVPSAAAVGPTTATTCSAPQQQTDSFASFLPLFLGLLNSA